MEDDSGYTEFTDEYELDNEFPNPICDIYDDVLQRPRGSSDAQKATQKPMRFLKRAPNTHNKIKRALPPLPSQNPEDSVYEDIEEAPKHSSHLGVLKVTKKFRVRNT